MSGGKFGYDQYKIQYIIDEIEQIIYNNGRKKTDEELKEEFYRDSDWYEQYPEDLYHYEYPKNVIAEFKKGIYYLKLAYTYAHRIDWLLSGDDGEESFLKRLYNELKTINYEENNK